MMVRVSSDRRAMSQRSPMMPTPTPTPTTASSSTSCYSPSYHHRHHHHHRHRHYRSFKVGDRVVLHGLKSDSASHLNGRHGHIGYKPVVDDTADDGIGTGADDINVNRIRPLPSPPDTATTDNHAMKDDPNLNLDRRLPVNLDIMDPNQPRLAVRPVNLVHERIFFNEIGRVTSRRGNRAAVASMPYSSSCSSTTPVTDNGRLRTTYAEALTVVLDLLRSIHAWKDEPRLDDDERIRKSLRNIQRLRRQQQEQSRTTTSNTRLSTTSSQQLQSQQRIATMHLENFLSLVWSDWSDIKQKLSGYPLNMWTHQLEQAKMIQNKDDDDSDDGHENQTTTITISTRRLVLEIIEKDILGVGSFDLRIQGDFWAVFVPIDNKNENGDSNGTFLIPFLNEDTVYQCVWIDDSPALKLCHDGRRHPSQLPIMLWRLTLIPVFGRLVCDGTLKIGGTESTVSRGLAMTANRHKARRLLATIQEAKYHKRIVQHLRQLDAKPSSNNTMGERLEMKEYHVAQQYPSRSSLSTLRELDPAARQHQIKKESPTKYDERLRKTKALTEMELLLAFVSSTDKVIPAGQPMGLWFFRRVGYNDDENPDRSGIIVTQKGPPAGYFRCTGDDGRPTATDILSGAVDVMNKIACPATSSDTSMNDRQYGRPAVIVVDDQECYEHLQQLFEKSGSFQLKGDKSTTTTTTTTVIHFFKPEEEEHPLENRHENILENRDGVVH